MLVRNIVRIMVASAALVFTSGCGTNEPIEGSQSTVEKGAFEPDTQLHFGIPEPNTREGREEINCPNPPCEVPPVDIDMCVFVQSTSSTVAIVEMLEDRGPKIGNPLDCETPNEYSTWLHYEYDLLVRKVVTGDTSLEGEAIRVVDVGLSFRHTGYWDHAELEKGELLMMGLRQSRGEWFNVSHLMVAADPDDLRPAVTSAGASEPKVLLPTNLQDFSAQATQVIGDYDNQCPHIGTSYLSDDTFEELVFVPDQPKCGLTE